MDRVDRDISLFPLYAVNIFSLATVLGGTYAVVAGKTGSVTLGSFGAMQIPSINDDNSKQIDAGTGFVSNVGLLRIFLAIIVLLCLPAVFLSSTSSSGWGLIPSQIIPALVVLLVWALPFDMLMARVFMSQAEGDSARIRYRQIIKLDAFLILGLVVFWGPFFLRLLVR